VVTIKFTFEARDDLKNIYEYIGLDSKLQAKRFVKSLKQKTEILKQYPEIGKLIFPEKFKKLRQLLYQSYRIIYHISDNVVTVITIHHQSRLPENIPSVKNYNE